MTKKLVEGMLTKNCKFTFKKAKKKWKHSLKMDTLYLNRFVLIEGIHRRSFKVIGNVLSEKKRKLVKSVTLYKLLASR